MNDSPSPNISVIITNAFRDSTITSFEYSWSPNNSNKSLLSVSYSARDSAPITWSTNNLSPYSWNGTPLNLPVSGGAFPDAAAIVFNHNATVSFESIKIWIDGHFCYLEN